MISESKIGVAEVIYIPHKNGVAASLLVEGITQISDFETELASQQEFLNNAEGVVLVGGLGLGLILPTLLGNDNVINVLVIEKYDDVIKLIGPYFIHPKLQIVCADIYTYYTIEQFDTIWIDVFTERDPAQKDINLLTHKYMSNLNVKNGWFGVWSYKEPIIIWNSRSKN